MEGATLGSQERQLLTWGIAIFLLGPLSAAVVAGAGSVWGLAESPREPLLVPVAAESRLLCGDGVNGPRCPGSSPGFPGVAGAAYVAPADVFVLAVAGVAPSQLDELSPTTHQTLSNVTVNCTLGNLYYPGSGVDTYSGCWEGGHYSVVVYDAGIHAVTSTIPLPTGLSCRSDWAMGPQLATLYCLTRNDTLLAIQLGGSGVVSQTSLPNSSNRSYPILWVDNRTGAVFEGDGLNRSVHAVDPSTGRVLATLTFPGYPVAISGDTGRNRLFVSFVPGCCADGNTSVFDLTTLTRISTVPAGGTYAQPVLDTTHGEVYLVNGGSLSPIDSSTGRLIGEVRFPFSWYTTAYDPTLDVFFSGVSGLAVFAEFLNVSHTTTTPGPYTAVPGVGSSLVPLVAAPGLAVGTVLFIALGWVQWRRQKMEGDRFLERLRAGPPPRD
jgi:hypothetical protein